MSLKDNATALLSRALEARENGNHYAGFKVGCLGCGPEGEIFLGANYKPRQDMEPTCAEEQVMLQAMEAGVVLSLLIVVGQPRKEDDPSRPLHCCGERCRPRMRRRAREGKAVSRETQIVCVHATNPRVREDFTLESLCAEYGETMDD